jgi:hypothetical protein
MSGLYRSSPMINNSPKIGQWFKTENAVVDHLMKHLGPYGYAVYSVICRYAGEKRECWPSQRNIAKKTGMSERQVNREIIKLMKMNVISGRKSVRGGKWANYKYFREFPSSWIIPKTDSLKPIDSQSYSHETVSPIKETSIKKINGRREDESSLEEKRRELVRAMTGGRGSHNSKWYD